MAPIAGSTPSTSKLLQIAELLIFADRLVRERNFSQAYVYIAKALSIDPSNLYTKAHVERLQLLVDASSRQTQLPKSPAGPEPSPLSFSRFIADNSGLRPRHFERRDDPQIVSNDRGTVTNDAKSDGDQLRVSISMSMAEALLDEDRFDEAMNSLAPAVLADPLNPLLVSLQKKIREKRERSTQGRDQARHVERFAGASVQGDSKGEVRDYLLLAMQLAVAGDLGGALTTIGRAYLVDPLNEDVPVCEQLILKTLKSDLGVEMASAAPMERVGEHSEAKRRLLEHLDKAQELLERDQFGEALSYVALAIMAAPNSGTPKPEIPGGLHSSDRSDSSPVISRSEPATGVSAEISARVRELLGIAQVLVERRDLEDAARVLLEAAAMIPGDGSLAELDRIVSRRFMEYSVLLHPLVPGSKTLDSIESAKKRSGLMERKAAIDHKQSPPHHSNLVAKPAREERWAESDSYAESRDRLKEIQGKVLECLGHLNAERMKEASASAREAAALEDSRTDLKTFAENVGALAQKVGNRVVLASTLLGTYEAVRQQAKILLYKFFYEELRLGIDKTLEVVPGSEVLLKRRAEVANALEACTLSTTESEKNSDPAGGVDSAKLTAEPRKTKKRSLEQMDISFPNDISRRAAQG